MIDRKNIRITRAATAYVAVALFVGAIGIGACVGDDPAGPGGDGSDSGSDAITSGDGSNLGDGSSGGDSCTGTTTCGADTCVDLQSDSNHCGTCDVACKTSAGTSFSCVKGICGNKVVQISAGQTQSCALLLDGTVWCWGSQASGQTGVISADGTAAPQKISVLANIVEVYAFGSSACARDNNGDVFCWGDNGNGETGQTVGLDPGCGGTCNPTPKKVTLPEKAAQLTGSLEVACMRSAGGNVYCWGRNSSDILNLGGDVDLKSSSPVKIGVFNNDVVDLDVGYTDYGSPGIHALGCAIRSDKTLWCWGSNTATYYEAGHTAGGGTPADIGCSGVGTTGYNCNPTPQQVLDLDAGAFGNASMVRTRNKGGCVLRGDKSVWCWGANSGGELGIGSLSVSPQPVPLLTLLDAGMEQIETSDLVTFSVDSAGQVYDWGDTTGAGLLGTGDYQPYQTGTPTKLPLLTGIKQISAMSDHGMALKTDGTIVLWGSNGFAKLGHAGGTNGDSLCQPGDAGNCNPTPQLLVNPPWQ
ncbi:MAG: hypothetical protein ABI183_23245 [Polyangiaceae bacterium]